jgi:hypothetical protein
VLFLLATRLLSKDFLLSFSFLFPKERIESTGNTLRFWDVGDFMECLGDVRKGIACWIVKMEYILTHE